MSSKGGTGTWEVNWNPKGIQKEGRAGDTLNGKKRPGCP